MAGIRVTHSIGDLARDLKRGSTAVPRRGPGIVRRNVNRGHKLAQGIAKRASGPHGTAYYKRITADMTGPMKGEYGPHDGGIPVGAGYRHGAGNHDLEKSLDIVAPAFRGQVDKLVDSIFWPGGDQ